MNHRLFLAPTLLLASGLLVACGSPADKPTGTATPAAETSVPSPASTARWTAPPVGEIIGAPQLQHALPGLWTGDWGDLLFRIEDDGRVVGAYKYDDGLIVGEIVGSTMVGWWCEKPSQSPPSDAGRVEMRLVDAGADTGPSIDGRWTYGESSEQWNENWDISQPSDVAPPEELVTRLALAEEECLAVDGR
ncbi:hypothetical protein BH09ACT3_BH09ACT3_02020 [soil metagenome]